MKKYRLSKFEADEIKRLTKKIFGKNSKVFLFGSRVDLKKRGGDIDLYIIPEKRDNLFDKKLKFLTELKLKIGEQKIDVIVNKDINRLIEQEALKNGIEL